MTVRLWQAKVDPAQQGVYRRFERETCLPMLYRQAGFLGALFLAEEDVASVLTFWEDRGSVEALSSSPSYVRLTRDLVARGLLLAEPSVAVWDVTGGELRVEALAEALRRTNRTLFPDGREG